MSLSAETASQREIARKRKSKARTRKNTESKAEVIKVAETVTEIENKMIKGQN